MQAGPKRCIPLSPDSRVLQEVSQVQVVRHDLQIRGSPLRAFSSSEGFHRGPKTSTGNIKICRICLMTYLCNFLIIGKSKEVAEAAFHRTKSLAFAKPWICDKSGKVTEPGSPDD